MSIWHEDRLLIDGELVAAEGGKTYDNFSPSTEEKIGVTADASVADTRRAIAAARRAFDTTDWSRNRELRVRCLKQLHQALQDNFDNLAQILVHEVGAPIQSTHGPQLEGPIEIIRWYGELLETYDFNEDLGNIEMFGGKHHRWVEKEAAGVVSAIVAYNYPIQLALAKLGPALAAGCTVVLKGAPDTPWSALALGKLIAEHTDIPAGVVNILTSSDVQVGVALTEHPDVDVITFTGSTPELKKASATEWEARLRPLGLAVGAVSTVGKVLDSDFVRDRDMLATLQTDEGPLRLLKSPIRFDGERGEMRLPPKLHEHTDEIVKGTAP